mmetsp:Transcript_15379/g.40725  ORF Transcript_15379/g.40725 Transcript_15379/m.40725 type:complete len:254 (+) Transcript_15379:905-1666(+)
MHVLVEDVREAVGVPAEHLERSVQLADAPVCAVAVGALVADPGQVPIELAESCLQGRVEGFQGIVEPGAHGGRDVALPEGLQLGLHALHGAPEHHAHGRPALEDRLQLVQRVLQINEPVLPAAVAAQLQQGGGVLPAAAGRARLSLPGAQEAVLELRGQGHVLVQRGSYASQGEVDRGRQHLHLRLRHCGGRPRPALLGLPPLRLQGGGAIGEQRVVIVDHSGRNVPDRAPLILPASVLRIRHDLGLCIRLPG